MKRTRSRPKNCCKTGAAAPCAWKRRSPRRSSANKARCGSSTWRCSRAGTCCSKATSASARPRCCAPSRVPSAASFERVEGTVDLMPADLVYHTYVDADGKPRIEPGPLLRHGEQLATFFFNEINRARPQVQSLLLARDGRTHRLGVQPRIPLPAHAGVRRPQPRREGRNLRAAVGRARPLHVRAAHAHARPKSRSGARWCSTRISTTSTSCCERVAPGVLPWQELNRIGAAIQRSVKASEALERYVLDLWDASQSPQRFGVRIDGVDMDKLILAGASPRGMMTLMRAARVVAWLAGRTLSRAGGRAEHRALGRWGIACSSRRSMSCGARRSPTRWWRRSWNACRRRARPWTRRRSSTTGLPYRVGGWRPGAHPGTRLGAGQEFVSHMSLYARPDPRRLDLRASLRDLSNDWLVRVHRQRASVPVHAIVDVSASMAFGARKTKLQVAADFVEALGQSAVAGGRCARACSPLTPRSAPICSCPR